MSSQRADDRHYSVVLGIFDTQYTADVWRQSQREWVLLAVRLESGESQVVEQPPFLSLKAALFAAEDVAQALIIS